MTITASRRRFLSGFATLLAAPAIVRASSLMQVKPWVDDLGTVEFVIREHWQPYMGLAQIKREGEAVAFDRIMAGDMVVMERPGVVRRWRASTDNDRIVGMATGKAFPVR